MKPQRSKPVGRRGIKGFISDVIFGTASCLNAIIPKKKQVSICSTPDFTDNARAFYEYIQTCPEDYKLRDHCIVWHVLNPVRAREINDKLGFSKYQVKFVRKNRLGSMFELFKSDYIISTHGLYSMIKLTEKQTSVMLMHGMMVKKCGYEFDNDIRLGINCGDYYFVTSSFYKKQYKKAFHCRDEQIYITGQPRNDCMYKDLNQWQFESIREFGKDYVLFLPTYRKSNNRNIDNGEDLNCSGMFFGGTESQWEVLNNKLVQLDKKMVIKPHPLEEKVDTGFLSSMSNIVVISDKWLLDRGLILNNILANSSKLITDFSGVYIDYLLLDKPVCFFIPDLEKYTNSRGLIFDNIEDYFAGIITNRFDRIAEFLNEDDTYRAKRKQICTILNEIKGPSASKSIFNIVFKN